MTCYCGATLTHAEILANLGCCTACLYGWADDEYEAREQTWLQEMADYGADWLAERANQRYAESQWARGGTNYSDWYTGDRGR